MLLFIVCYWLLYMSMLHTRSSVATYFAQQQVVESITAISGQTHTHSRSIALIYSARQATDVANMSRIRPHSDTHTCCIMENLALWLTKYLHKWEFTDDVDNRDALDDKYVQTASQLNRHTCRFDVGENYIVKLFVCVCVIILHVIILS